MRNVVFAVAGAALLGAGLTAESPRTQAATAAKAPVKMAVSHSTPKLGPSIESQNQLVAQYCAGCHSERGKAGGLVLAGFDAATVEQHPETAEKMIRKLRAGMMPPPRRGIRRRQRSRRSSTRSRRASTRRRRSVRIRAGVRSSV